MVKLLITRPEPAASAFAADVIARLGRPIDVVICPLLDIRPLGSPVDPSKYDGVVIASQAAAKTLAPAPRPGFPAWCVGDKTAETAGLLGYRANSASGDADDLVDLVLRENSGQRLLHVRGEYSRGNIAARIAQGGVTCDEVLSYRQALTKLSREALELLEGDETVVAPLFSPRTAKTLFSQTKNTNLLSVVAISQAVAAEVPRADVRQIIVADRPDGESMAAATCRLLKAPSQR